jgi:hypothetical protein
MHMALPVRLPIVKPGTTGNRPGTGKKVTFQLKNDVKLPGAGGNRSNNRRHRSGETVRQSGIYEVIHDREHREAHEVVMISGERFPDCETCKERVRFRLVRTAPYIFQDEDFGEGQ